MLSIYFLVVLLPRATTLRAEKESMVSKLLTVIIDQDVCVLADNPRFLQACDNNFRPQWSHSSASNLAWQYHRREDDTVNHPALIRPCLCWSFRSCRKQCVHLGKSDDDGDGEAVLVGHSLLSGTILDRLSGSPTGS